MDIRFSPSEQIAGALVQAAREAFGPEAAADFAPDVKPAEPRFGDFQANGVLPWAKRAKTNPREAATALVAALQSGGELDAKAVSWEIAGPGFINFTLSPAWLLGWLAKYTDETELHEAAGSLHHSRTVVVDYSSPNTAKQMHVGHIRSTVIGEAICRLLAFCGAKVIADNHLGDWGTQFGILLLQIKEEGYDLDAPHEDPLADLEGLYKRGSARFKEDEAVQEQARAELVALQKGDPNDPLGAENLRLWKKITEVSYTAFEEIYQRLGVRFDHVLGESFYRDKVERVYKELEEAGLAEESEGALVVFHPEHPRFKEQPFLVRKRDGASNYAATDLATVLFRVEEWQAGEMIYVTDARQKDHFEQLFLTVEKWFDQKDYARPVLQHVTFGTILGEDGKAIKTRSGEPVKLKALLDEAVQRARALIDAKSSDLPEEEKQRVAEVVGLGAVRYADLSQNRTSDYVFSFDKMLALDGNTAPYLLYAVARIHSIFRKAEIAPGEGEKKATAPETEGELALARKLVQFPTTLAQTLGDLRPHVLCTYLYELSGTFSTFYNADRVIVEDEAVKARRLMLCARTLRTLETGLHLLGIETLERM